MSLSPPRPLTGRWHLSRRFRPSLEVLEDRWTPTAPEFGFALPLGGTAIDAVHGSATDAAGNIYLVGEFQGSVDFDTQAVTANDTLTALNAGKNTFIASYDAAGAFRWVTHLGSPDATFGDTVGHAIALDPLGGNIYVTGYFTGKFADGGGIEATSQGLDIFVTKLVHGPTNASVIWSKIIQSGGAEQGLALTATQTDVFIAGLFSGTVDFNPLAGVTNNLVANGSQAGFVLDLNSGGTYVWAKALSASDASRSSGIAWQGSHLYVTGWFQGTLQLSGVHSTNPGATDGYLAKMELADGDFVFSGSFGGPSGAVVTPHAIAVDSAGNSYLVGSLSGSGGVTIGGDTLPLGTADGFLAKFNTNAVPLWGRKISGGEASAQGVAVDSADNAYVTGWFSAGGPLTFGGSSTSLTTPNEDAYVLSADAAGNLLWALASSGSASSSARGRTMAVNVDGLVYIGGSFDGAVDFGPEALAGTSDGFVWQLTPPPFTVALPGPGIHQVQISGDNLQFLDADGDPVGPPIPLNNANEILITGTAGGDTLVLDSANLGSWDGSITFAGGAGDSLVLRGSVVYSPGSATVTVGSASVAYDAIDHIQIDEFAAAYLIDGNADGNQLRVFKSGSTDLAYQFDAEPVVILTNGLTDLDSFDFTGEGGDDTLIVDFSSGFFALPAGVHLSGGDQADTVEIRGGVTDAVIAYVNAGTGSIELDDNDGGVNDNLLVSFDTGEALLLMTTAGTVNDVLLVLPATSDVAELSDGGNVADGKLLLQGASIVTTGFKAPTGSLGIHLGDGDDVLTVESVDAAYRASLTIAGEGSTSVDAVFLNADLALGSAASAGNLAITAEAVNLATVTVVTQTGTGNVTLAGEVNLTGDVIIDTTTAMVGDVDLDAIDGSHALTIDASGAVSLGNVGFDIPLTEASIRAGDDLAINGWIETAGGPIHLEADSVASGDGLLSLLAGSSVHTTGTLTLRSADLAIDNSATIQAGVIEFFTSVGSRSIAIGGGIGDYAVDDGELSQLTGVASLVIGQSGVQSGSIAFTSATLSGNPAVLASTSGQILLVTSAGAPALATGAGAITLQAGSNGIAAQNSDNEPELQTTGTISLPTSGGAIGSSVKPIDIAANAGLLTITTTSAAGDVFIDGLGGLAFSTVATSGGDITLSASEIDFVGGVGSVTGSGALILQPSTATQAIDIGRGSEAGQFDLTQADLAALADGFAAITIGREAGQHAITIGFGTSVEFLDPVTIRSQATGGGSILVAELLIGQQAITLDAGTKAISLVADIISDGAAIHLTGSVVLGGGSGSSFTIDATHLGDFPAGGDIVIDGTVDATISGQQHLTLDAGTAGDLAITGSVGGAVRLGQFTILQANDVALSSVRATSVIQQMGGGSTALDGVIDTNGAGGVVIHAGGIELSAASNQRIVTSGGGIVHLDAQAGTLILPETGAGFEIQANGAVTLSASSIQLAGDISASSQVVSFVGPVDILGSATIQAGAIALGGDVQVADGVTGSVFTAPTLDLGLSLPIFDIGTAANLQLTTSIMGVAGADLVKMGAGELVLSGASINTYSGATLVQAGVLRLDKAVAIPAGTQLFIGDDDVGNGQASVIVSATNAIADTAQITVYQDGTLDLSGYSDTVGPVTLLRGTAQLGAGVWTVNGLLSLVGGDVSIGSGGQLKLGGNVLASSYDAATPSHISGAGTLSLGSFSRTFTTEDGAASTDLLIEVGLVGSGGAGFIKDGFGSLRLDGTSTYPGVTQVLAGDLAVAGSLLGHVQVNGGSLTPDVLDVAGNLVFTASASLHVRVDGASEYGQVAVAGAVQLGAGLAALDLAGTYLPNDSDVFVLIDGQGSLPVSGWFTGLPEGTRFQLNGQWLRITYQGGSDGHDVVLTEGNPPTSTIVFPADGTAYRTASWNGGGPIRGTAGDAGGIASVQVSIRDIGTGAYWDGDGFDSATLVFITAAGTSNWSWALSAAELTIGHSYEVGSLATDLAGNVQGAMSVAGFTFVAPPSDGLGTVRKGTWKLSVGLNASTDIGPFTVAVPGGFQAGDRPVVGDWDGDGVQTPGIFRAGEWYLSNDASGLIHLTVSGFGQAGDRAVVGDWDGNGVDSIGFVRVADGAATWHLNNDLDSTGDLLTFTFRGGKGETYLSGDWDGDGDDTPGVFHKGKWYFRQENNTGGADLTVAFGKAGDRALAGDWDGDGIDSIGTVRVRTGLATWRLRNQLMGPIDVPLIRTLAPTGTRFLTGVWQDAAPLTSLTFQPLPVRQKQGFPSNPLLEAWNLR